MTYSLGIDLGTTNSAAAIADDQGVRMLSLGHDGPIVASVIHVTGDGSTTFGRAAVRRAEGDPAGVAREFKRRFGDETPFLLHGTPVAANDLTLLLATHLVEAATELQGETPTDLVVCHPANWGPFKTSLLSDTLANSALPSHRLVTEPEAAAIHYAAQSRVADGTTVAVYDLGGGTFDVAILRKTTDGWERIGRPGGIERLGGIDFDTAVFHHVLRSLDLDLDAYDDDDIAVQAGVARLRADCTEAKHTLSADTSAVVSVLLPGRSEQVRITRGEFETLIAPAIARSLDTFDNTISAAGLTYEQLDRVLMVGGSSRIPLVAERVASHTGRPLATDAHPKHACALGAAQLAASTRSASVRAPATPSAPPTPSTPSSAEQPANPPTPPAATPPSTPAAAAAPPPTPPADAPAPAPPTPAAPPSPASQASQADDLQLRQPLGGMFQELPHISEGLPEFMDRGRGRQPAPPPLDVPRPVARPLQPPAAVSPAAQPSGWNVPATQANPVLVPNEFHVPGQGRPAPQVHRPKKKRSASMFFLGLVLVVGLGGAAAYALDLFELPSTGGTTTSSTTTTAADGSDGTAGEGGSTPTETSLVNNTNCPDDRIPDPNITYQIKEIAADDKDGGANARSGPGLGADTPPVTVLPSFTQLELDLTKCELDTDGRAWWGVIVDGNQLWVSSNLIIPVG
ncbi:MAG: Hsp70 family protein [Acidimicrobiales bacterium]